MYVMYVIGGGCAGGVVLALRAVSTQVLARKLKLFLTLVGLLYVYCPNVLYGVLFLARSNTSQIQDIMHS